MLDQKRAFGLPARGSFRSGPPSPWIARSFRISITTRTRRTASSSRRRAGTARCSPATNRCSRGPTRRSTFERSMVEREGAGAAHAHPKARRAGVGTPPGRCRARCSDAPLWSSDPGRIAPINAASLDARRSHDYGVRTALARARLISIRSCRSLGRSQAAVAQLESLVNADSPSTRTGPLRV